MSLIWPLMIAGELADQALKLMRHRLGECPEDGCLGWNGHPAPHIKEGATVG